MPLLGGAIDGLELGLPAPVLVGLVALPRPALELLVPPFLLGRQCRHLSYSPRVQCEAGTLNHIFKKFSRGILSPQNFPKKRTPFRDVLMKFTTQT